MDGAAFGLGGGRALLTESGWWEKWLSVAGDKRSQVGWVQDQPWKLARVMWTLLFVVSSTVRDLYCVACCQLKGWMKPLILFWADKWQTPIFALESLSDVWEEGQGWETCSKSSSQEQEVMFTELILLPAPHSTRCFTHTLKNDFILRITLWGGKSKYRIPILRFKTRFRKTA